MLRLQPIIQGFEDVQGEPLSFKPVDSGVPLDHPGMPTTRLAHYPNALPIGSQLEEYRIDQVLGAGGFGITYRAIDLQLRTHVAVKEYYPMPYASRTHDGMTVAPSVRGREISSQATLSNYDWGAERYLEEARLLARIRHPNVVRVSRYFGANGSAYIVMDYEEGQVLGEILAGRRTLEESRIRGLLGQLLSALEAVHHEGFLHRDIKPDNLLVRSKDDSLVLIDFGAARRTIDNANNEVTCLVTPGYSPPEQYASNPVRYGPRTDIYSLGAVLYRCISGIVPPPAAERLIEDEMPEPAEVTEGEYSAELLQVISRALTLQPQDRFQEVAEIRAMLDRSMGRGVSVSPRQRLRGTGPQAGAGILKPFRAAARKYPFPSAQRLQCALRAGWRGHTSVIAAVLLLLLGTALPRLWQSVSHQAPSAAKPELSAKRSLSAPDLSTMELFTPVAPVVTAAEITVVADDDSREVAEAPVAATAEDTFATIAPAANGDRIQELLDLARESLDDYRLSTPTGHNANHYFDQIRDLDPDHAAARWGYQQIAARYSELAETQLQRGNRGKADRYLELGLKFDSDNAELLGLRQRMAATSAPESPPEKEKESLLSGFKRLLTEELPAASTGKQADLGMETTNR